MRIRALGAAIVASLLAVSGAAGTTAQTPTPKRGGTLVIGTRTTSEPACLNVLLNRAPSTPSTSFSWVHTR